MKAMCWLLMLFMLLFAQAVWAGQWLPGIVHCHSTFSDGLQTPEAVAQMAQKSGAKFLILTDHYEQIDSDKERPDSDKKKKGAMIADDQGFENYRRRCLSLSRSDFVVIPGAEITSFWSAGVSHLLAIGDMGHRDEVIITSQLKNNSQQELIEILNKKREGILTVAAHPNAISLVSVSERPWEPGIFLFDPGAAKGLSGIEFFNEGADGYLKTLGWYRNLLAQVNNVFVTSGCDSHGPEPGDPARWKRKTWVFCDDFSRESVLFAMRAGRTYAANWDVKFLSLDPIPGSTAQKVAQAQLTCQVVFPTMSTSKKKIRVYRDGQLLKNSEKEIPIGAKTYKYRCSDPSARGLHRYVIEVEGVLVTSPIVLEVTGEPKKSQIGNFGPCVNGNLIAFLSDRDGPANVWVMDLEGRGQRKLTNFTQSVTGVVVMPHTRKIVCQTEDMYLWAMNDDGSNMKRSNFRGSKYSICWWDERTISFNQTRNGKLILMTTTIDARNNFSQPQEWRGGCLGTHQDHAASLDLGSDRVEWVHPEKSYPGSGVYRNFYVLSVDKGDGNWEIYLLDMSTRRYTQLTSHPAQDSSPSISAEGVIVFASDRTGSAEIYRYDGDKKNVVQLTYGSDAERAEIKSWERGTKSKIETSIKKKVEDFFRDFPWLR